MWPGFFVIDISAIWTVSVFVGFISNSVIFLFLVCRLHSINTACPLVDLNWDLPEMNRI